MSYARRFAVGPVEVQVTSNEESVLDYLGEFYTATGAALPGHGWTVDAQVGLPEPDANTNQWGVSWRIDRSDHTIHLRAGAAESLSITARKCVREVLVDYCEQQRYTMLHASAVVDEALTIVVVGDKGSGKTTLALKAALRHGMRYVSNDHLIMYGRDGAGTLTLTSLPTLIPLKIGTFLDLESALPEPWDRDGLDVEAYRASSRSEVYSLDWRVLYTYRRLGHDNPITVDLGPRRSPVTTLIVLANYSPGDAGEPEPVADPVTELLAHVRTDWMFDPTLNQRYLPRAERGRDEYLADARRIVTALAERSTVVRWSHRSDPAPILEFAANRRLA
ncbi:hypothetical protein [Micromonospora sp. NPDC005171]|uniref:hypothetical protein n=1 Tax=Micromonospora sp. NPDC005171 TaxID=3156866 RepID=UPI0033A27C6C